jgi:hypothetical protein
MADSSVAITPGVGAPIRVLTGLGTGSADQQVISIADSAGNLLGTSGAPLPVSIPASVLVIGKVLPAPSTTGTNSSVAGTTSASTTLLASNASRLGASVFNDSTAVLYLSLGATATTTNYTVQVPAGGYYEFTNPGVIYTGIITGTWAAANGNARLTELS